MTNFGDVFIVDRVGCGKSDGDMKHRYGQGLVTSMSQPLGWVEFGLVVLNWVTF